MLLELLENYTENLITLSSNTQPSIFEQNVICINLENSLTIATLQQYISYLLFVLSEICAPFYITIANN